MTDTGALIPEGYDEFLRGLKERIRTAQVRAALAVNRELVLLYWRIGQDILERQRQSGWGSKVIDRLAADLRSAFPEMSGFSPRNLKYMRAFAEAWPDEDFVQQVAAQLPWFHNCTILDKLKNLAERIWYAQQTIENGWSRNILIHQIESNLFHRKGKAITNFDRTLPAPQSELAQQIIKDPYRNATWREDSSLSFRNFFWNSASALRSSGVNTHLKLTARISLSIYSFITLNFDASLSSI